MALEKHAGACTKYFFFPALHHFRRFVVWYAQKKGERRLARLPFGDENEMSMVPMKTMATDAELIQTVRSGAPAAFNALVERHYGLVYSISLARLQDRELAQDLAQEVFLRAYLLLDRLEAPEFFPAWVARITRNLATDWQRRGSRASRLLPMTPIEEVPHDIPDSGLVDARERLDSKQRCAALHQALASLAPEHRELVLMHYMEGLSHRDIAGRLGMDHSTVTRQLGRALKNMRGMLEPILVESTASLRASSAARTQALSIALVAASIPEASRTAAVSAAAQCLEGAAELSASKSSGGSILAAIAHFFRSLLFIKTGVEVMSAAKVVTTVIVAAAIIGGGSYWIVSKDASPPARPRIPTAPAVDSKPLSFGSRAPAGSRFVYRIESTTDNVVNLPATAPPPRTINQKTQYSQEYAVDVREASPDGGRVLELEILALAMDMDYGGPEDFVRFQESPSYAHQGARSQGRTGRDENGLHVGRGAKSQGAHETRWRNGVYRRGGCIGELARHQGPADPGDDSPGNDFRGCL